MLIAQCDGPRCIEQRPITAHSLRTLEPQPGAEGWTTYQDRATGALYHFCSAACLERWVRAQVHAVASTIVLTPPSRTS